MTAQTASVSKNSGVAKWLWLIVVAIVVLDQLTKWLCVQRLQLGVPVTILPFFDLLLAHNEGAAFSFLHDAGGWQRWVLTGISLVVGAALVFWLWRLPKGHKLLAVAIACILGGDLGNLWDRAMTGYVVDFISVYYADWRFATFNVADAAISCGAALLALDLVLGEGRHE